MAGLGTELGIEHIGCHAARCANGADEYKGMSGVRRAEIQYRLIVDIVASKLYAVATAIDMNAYRCVRDALSLCLERKDRQYNEPHVLAVRQCVQQMCLSTQDATAEPITFVVDRNDAFGRRAKAWYQISVDNSEISHHHRLGPYSDDDRLNAPGLQAADMLAYSFFREVAGRPGWQWKQLRPAIKLSEFITSAPFWQQLQENFEEAARLKAASTET